MEYLDIVNDQNQIIGRASKEEIYQKRLTHRIVHIFVFNDKQEMLLQKRSHAKHYCPLHWVTAASGHVRAGENYKQAALREFKEELGCLPGKIQFSYKDLYQDLERGINKFLGSFTTQYNGPFKIDAREVAEVKFFNLDKIKQMINQKEKLHPELLFLLEKYYLMTPTIKY